MLAQPLSKPLNLPSLTIEGFRGIKSLSIPRLGQVTLISGKNAVGKTTVLEAVQLYATHGHPGVIRNILRDRNELIPVINDDGNEMSAPNLESLFYGRLTSENSRASIGVSGTGTHRLSIMPENQMSLFSDEVSEAEIRIQFQDRARRISSRSILSPTVSRRTGIASAIGRSHEGNSYNIACESLGPSVLDNRDIDRMWNKVALTADEESAIKALRLVYGDEVRAISIVGGTGPSIKLGNRYPIVKIDGHDRPVPLRSLGDGATRIFGVALALANSQGGFLVIDEAENGVHHSVQRDFWRMVIQTAQENDVQVIATTHSWDCVVGFGQALKDIEAEAGLLVHLSRNGDGIRATEYSGEDLQTAIRHGTEVR